MDGTLLRVLADAITRYLALAEVGQPSTSQTGQLVAAWRAVLRLHRPTVRAECPGCAHRRGEMCDVWRVAVAYFLRSSPSARASGTDPSGTGASETGPS